MCLPPPCSPSPASKYNNWLIRLVWQPPSQLSISILTLTTVCSSHRPLMVFLKHKSDHFTALLKFLSRIPITLRTKPKILTQPKRLYMFWLLPNFQTSSFMTFFLVYLLSSYNWLDVLLKAGSKIFQRSTSILLGN